MRVDMSIDKEPYWVQKEYDGRIDYHSIQYQFIIKIGQHYPIPSEDYMEAKLEWVFKRKVVPKYLKDLESEIVAEFLKELAE